MRLSELRILYGVFNNEREAVQRAIKSIAENYVSVDNFEQGDYFHYDDYYYSHDEYVMTYDGDAIHRDNAFWCDGLSEYFNEDDAVTVYECRHENLYSRRWAERNSELSYYRGDYYDSDALDSRGLVYVQDSREIDEEDNAYYHDGDGYYSYPPEDREEYVRGYHNGSYRSVNFDGKSKYRIGYEIEKEDQEILESINIEDFESATDYNWRKEKDGSLDDDKGYELISPTFEFNIEKIFNHIESSNVLLDHINAGTSKKCGGHIHLSEKGVSGYDLFEKVKGYTPLLYALYYGRVNQHYCKGKANDDLKCDNEKYQAIKIHGDRIEFRIISAVPNVTTLKWRSKLLMMILQNPTSDIIRAYYNVDTKFTKLLKQTYSDDKLVILKERFIEFTKQFEGIDINKDKK